MIQGIPDLGLPSDAANGRTYCAVLADEEGEAIAQEVSAAYDYCVGNRKPLSASEGAEVNGGNFPDCTSDFSSVGCDIYTEALYRETQTFDEPTHTVAPNQGQPGHGDILKRMRALAIASSLPSGQWHFVGGIPFGPLM